MNIFDQLTRPTSILMVLSIGSAALPAAHADATHFVGPRNTIPRTVASQPSTSGVVQLQASRDASGTCQMVRMVHCGHPGKGVNRLERVDVACGEMRLSAR